MRLNHFLALSEKMTRNHEEPIIMGADRTVLRQSHLDPPKTVVVCAFAEERDVLVLGDRRLDGFF